MAPLENYIVEHCAPTLACLKTGTLFCVDIADTAELLRQIALWNSGLGDRGVSLTLLRQRGLRALVYMYRRSQLARDLAANDTASFLRGFGYTSMEPERALEHLKERLHTSEGFPHEIGVFLGYPLCDVLGYITNRGRNSKLTGCWQVYGDAEEAARQFARFRKCRDLYARLWREGKTVRQLTVCA